MQRTKAPQHSGEPMFKDAIGRSAAIVDSDFIAFVVVKDRRIVWANTAMHRMFGYEPDELIGFPTRRFFPDDESYETFGRDAYSAVGEDKTYRVTIPQKRKDGTTGWYEFNVSRLADQPGHVIAAIIDRTENLNLLKQLEISELRYRTVVQDQTEVIARVVPDGRFLFVNDVFCRLFGKTAEEMIGHRWQSDPAHPDDVPMIEAKLRELSPGNPVVTVENRVFVSGGELRWMQFVNRGFFDANGRLREFQSVGRDITSLKEVEAALRESKERLDLALAGSGLSFWDLDLVKHTVLTDGRISEILGWSADELGKQAFWSELLDPRDRLQFDRAMAAHLQGDAPHFHSEHRLRHKAGHWVVVEQRGRITRRDASGTPLRMVGTLMDITLRKRLNDEGMELLKRVETLILDAARGPSGALPEPDPAEGLTRRQRQTVTMIAKGMTSAQIARSLNISTATAIGHRRELMKKLGLHSAAEVTRFAVRHKLVSD